MFLESAQLPPFYGERRIHCHEGTNIVSVGHKVEQVTARSHRPFSQWVLDQEHLHLAQLRFFLAQAGVPPRCIRECRVDSMLLQAGTKKHRDIQQKVLKVTWKSLAESQQCAFQLAWPSSECEEPVFRAEAIEHDSKTILDFDPPLPVTDLVSGDRLPVESDRRKGRRDLTMSRFSEVVRGRNDGRQISPLLVQEISRDSRDRGGFTDPPLHLVPAL